MRLIVPILFASLLLPSLASAAPFKGQMKFTSKAPKEDIFGTAKGTADLDINLDDLTQIKGTITVPVKSMKTGNEKRDEHLRAPGWLDEAQFPNITFEVTGAEKAGETQTKNDVSVADVKVTGQFTLHGVTTALSAPATIKWKADGKAKITTKFVIKLADYNVKGKGSLVGSKVGETIACEATLVGKTK